MVQYLLAIAIAAFSIVAVVIGGPSPESLLLLAFTAIGVIALFPTLVRQHAPLLIGVFQALSTGLIIFGWFMVMDSAGSEMAGEDLTLAVTFVTVGAFGLLAMGIPASRLGEPQVPQQPYVDPAMVQQQQLAAAPQEGSLFVPNDQPPEVDPRQFFSKMDSVLREESSSLAKPELTGDDDPTTHFSREELEQIRQYAGKAQSSKDEDPTTLFSKSEIDEIRQYAGRLASEAKNKE